MQGALVDVPALEVEGQFSVVRPTPSGFHSSLKLFGFCEIESEVLFANMVRVGPVDADLG